MTMLKYFITSKAKRNLLKFFLTDINASYYTREASRLTGEPLNAVRRELGYLEKAGLVRSRMQGNLKYYEIVRSFPFLAEWRRIILEPTDSVSAPPDIVIAVSQSCEPQARQEAKQSIPEQSPTLENIITQFQTKFNDINSITLAVIHGEAARSEKIPEGGIELLIVGDINKDVLLEIIADLEVNTGVDISLMHLTGSGFDYRNAQGDPFIRRIWGEKKLVVKGRH